MIPRIVWTVLVSCIWFSSTTVYAIHPSRIHSDNLKPALTKLDHNIRKFLSQNKIPGCSVAVVHQDKVVFLKGYGKRAVAQPHAIDADTIFQLGSVSKPVAASLMINLEQQGIVDLDDPVNRYLKTFSLKGRQKASALKIRHILSHSSGIPRAGFNNLIEAHAPYNKIVSTLQKVSPRTKVGKRYDYNNAMYGLLSDITKAATHLSFPRALEKHVLTPLKMSRTSVGLSGIQNDENKAYPHLKSGKKGFMTCPTYSKGYYAVAPAGGINSTARDMAKFLKAQMGYHPEVASPSSLLRMHKPLILTNNVLNSAVSHPSLIKNTYYGMGWRIAQFSHHKLVFHAGWLKGFTNFIGFIPEHKIGIVILHNSESKFSTKVATQFLESFLSPSKMHTAEVKSTKIKKKSRPMIIKPKTKKKTRTAKAKVVRRN